MRFRTGGFLAILAAAALLWGPRASAATEPAGATGSAFGVSVTSSLLGTLQAPIPGGASGSVTDPGTHFGPLQVTTAVTGVSGVLEAARLDAEAGGTIAAEAPQVSSGRRCRVSRLPASSSPPTSRAPVKRTRSPAQGRCTWGRSSSAVRRYR